MTPGPPPSTPPPAAAAAEGLPSPPADDDLPSPPVEDLPSPPSDLPSPPEFPSPPTTPQHADYPDLPELPDTPIDHGGRKSEAMYSSLPEVVLGDHMTLPQVVDGADVKMVLPSDPLALPSENDGMEVAPMRRPTYPIEPDESQLNDGTETLMSKTGWIRQKRNRLILAVAALVILLVIAGIAAGVVAGVVINRNQNNSQQQNSGSNGNGNNGGGGSNGGGGGGTTGGGGGVGPPGDAPTAPVAPTGPTAPTAEGLPTKTGFGVPTSFPDKPAGTGDPSVCTGSFCPQILASAQYTNPQNAVGTTFMFSRGLDQAIWYRVVEGGVWRDEWKSLGGTFTSQPSAISIQLRRVDVFAVSSGGVMFKTFQNDVWDEAWTSLGGGFAGPPAVCSLFGGNMNIIGVDGSRNVLRKNTADGRVWEPTGDRWDSLGGPVGGNVDIACTNPLSGVLRIDVVALGTGSTSAMVSKRYNGTSKSWERDWGHGWGVLKGAPTVVSYNDRVDYLGVGVDGKLWWRGWTLANGYADAQDLGGTVAVTLQSAITAFATGEARLDVLAVGTDGKLKHLTRLSGIWGTAWEDLGGNFQSAPKAVVTDVAKGSVSVFGVGPGGKIIHANFEVGAGWAWGKQQWYSDDGAMTTGWYASGP
ncbi:hypothetical protein B0T14DRAFT_566375 [Immersiella caudata]|uniref:PLL-like beta propeller domain-containing protein n=1 Tax=Immersiella caudata TaxID=314043 RepID=A0AA40BZB0_9PEZI|nr:hypothetical protein B0T14DRAFT_566375 [Immersiella caudata]